MLSEKEIKEGVGVDQGTRIKIVYSDPESTADKPLSKIEVFGTFIGTGLASGFAYEPSDHGQKPIVSNQYTVFYYLTSATRQLRWFDPIKTEVYFLDS